MNNDTFLISKMKVKFLKELVIRLGSFSAKYPGLKLAYDFNVFVPLVLASRDYVPRKLMLSPSVGVGICPRPRSCPRPR